MHRVSFLCLSAVALAPLSPVLAEVSPPPAMSDTESGISALMPAGAKVPFSGHAGELLVSGRAAFAVAADKDGRVPAAAGHFGDRAEGGRVIVFAHDGMPGCDARLNTAAARWASRKKTPVVALLSWDQGRGDALRKLGATVRLPDSPEGVAGCDLVVLHQNHRLGESAWRDAIVAHLNRGGGLLVSATTWALSDEELSALNGLIAPAGLRVHGSGDFTHPGAAPRTLSLPVAVESLRSPSAFTAAERAAAGAVLEKAAMIGVIPTAVREAIDAHRAKIPFLTPTSAAPHKLGADALADLRLLVEASDFAALAPDKLFAHPSHREFPGACLPGARPVDRTLSLRLDSPSEKAMMNHADRGTWMETGLYAEAGKPVTVSIPAELAGKGLRVMIGTHDDLEWRVGNNTEELRRPPVITRTAALDAPEITVGCVYGGLVRIGVPAGAAFGARDVRVRGAVETPVYTLGETTAEQWAAERAKPGAQGILRVYGLTAYIPADRLRSAPDIAAVARHWDKVMRTGDDWLAYGKWRKRPELIMEDAQVSWGLHYAAYPVMLGPGDRPELLSSPEVAAGGDWGVYHELGHTFQMNYLDDYNLGTHAEVEVNLLPGLLYQKLWDKSAWDGPVHSTYDAQSRLADRKAFEALPSRSRTWKAACEGSAAAYDFHFSIVEAFGWGVWRDTLNRLGTWKQNPSADPELGSLDEGDEDQRRRDRIFVCLSRASGHNLKPWFNRFGLGRGEFPLGKNACAAVASLPSWNGNRKITRIEGPDALKLSSLREGDPVATYRAVDPDPAEVFEWDIFAGNEDGAFVLSKRTGVLTRVKADAAPRTLVLRVRDCGVPRSEKRLTVRVTP